MHLTQANHQKWQMFLKEERIGYRMVYYTLHAGRVNRQESR